MWVGATAPFDPLPGEPPYVVGVAPKTKKKKKKKTKTQKTSQVGWLKQETFISHSSGGWEIQDQGAVRFSVWGEPSLSLLCVFSLCPHVVERGHKLSPVSSSKGTNLIARLYPRDQIPFQRPHLRIPPLEIRRGHKHSSPQ